MIKATLEIAIRNGTFKLQTGDITKVPADAIGNAANSRLVGGGGVDGAIHRAGGPSIMGELDDIRARIGQCPPGDAVVTGAGDLPAKWVLHAVGPRYQDGESGEAAALMSCYRKCLSLADGLGARTLTLPAISTGVFGYPLEEAAMIAVRATAESLAGDLTKLTCISFVLFGDHAFEVFSQATLKVVPQLS